MEAEDYPFMGSVLREDHKIVKKDWLGKNPSQSRLLLP
jgi:hypothetical protein